MRHSQCPEQRQADHPGRFIGQPELNQTRTGDRLECHDNHPKIPVHPAGQKTGELTEGGASAPNQGAVLAGSPVLIGLQSLLKQQTLAGNFAMRLRWNFHRNMLAQSLSFYQDEFAGRVAAKVMQTALAVRDTWMILADILVFVVIYFITIALVVGNFDTWLLVPFSVWLGLYGLAVWYFVPRLARVAQAQADARSMMTGRITDAYTNITTVKLFSHTQRESLYGKSA